MKRQARQRGGNHSS